MSDEATTVKELIKTLEDGRDGFATAAQRLDSNSAVDVGRRFHEFSAQRGAMADELRRCAQLEGYAVPQGGTVAGAVHRGWIAVKDALTGDDARSRITAFTTAYAASAVMVSICGSCRTAMAPNGESSWRCRRREGLGSKLLALSSKL